MSISNVSPPKPPEHPNTVTLTRLSPASHPSVISRVKEICVQAFTRESVASQITSASPTSFLPSAFAAIKDGEVVGYVCLKKYNQAKSENGGECRSAVLHTLCVDNSTRSSGIGSAIVLALKNRAIQNDLHYLLLAAALGPTQSRLITFYSRFNFRVIPDAEGASNMGEGLSNKITEEGDVAKQIDNTSIKNDFLTPILIPPLLQPLEVSPLS